MEHSTFGRLGLFKIHMVKSFYLSTDFSNSVDGGWTRVSWGEHEWRSEDVVEYKLDEDYDAYR